MSETATKETKSVLSTTVFKSEGDFINQLIDEVAAEPSGGRKKNVDVGKLVALAAENGVAPDKEYTNPGLARMSIGNILRATARRRGGLKVGGKWRAAPAEFETKVTEDRDGNKIEKPKAEKTAAEKTATKTKDKTSAKSRSKAA